MIQVLLADDEPMIRAGVRAILTTDPEIDVIAEASDGREAVELAVAHRPDIALLDIRMPRLDGLAAAVEITRAAPTVGVAILTTFGDDSYLTQALDGGARASYSSRATRASCSRSPAAAPTWPRRSPPG